MIKQCCTSPPKPQIFPQIALGTNKQTSKIFKIWMEISLSVALSTFRVWIMGGVSFQLIGKWRGRRLWKSPSLTTSSRTATFANLDFSQIWLHSKQLQSPDGAQLTNTWSILSSSFIKKKFSSCTIVCIQNYQKTHFKSNKRFNFFQALRTRNSLAGCRNQNSRWWVNKVYNIARICSGEAIAISAKCNSTTAFGVICIVQSTAVSRCSNAVMCTELSISVLELSIAHILWSHTCKQTHVQNCRAVRADLFNSLEVVWSCSWNQFVGNANAGLQQCRQECRSAELQDCTALSAAVQQCRPPHSLT